MKQLTNDERRDIRKLLDQKKDLELSAINAADPGWEQRIEDRKNKVALGRLRVEKDVVEMKAIESQIRTLEGKRAEIELRIRKKMPLKKRDKYDGCPTHKDLCDAVGEICVQIDDTEMARDAAGKKVLALNAKYLGLQSKLAQCTTREDVAAAKIL